MAVTYWDDALTFYRMALEDDEYPHFKGVSPKFHSAVSHLR